MQGYDDHELDYDYEYYKPYRRKTLTFVALITATFLIVFFLLVIFATKPKHFTEKEITQQNNIENIIIEEYYPVP